jgi:hypothetical protein
MLMLLGAAWALEEKYKQEYGEKGCLSIGDRMLLEE